jgi:protein gp37
MGQTTIGWTATVLGDGTTLPGYSYNPWIGCEKVSSGCLNCYAERQNRTWGWVDKWGGERKKTSTNNSKKVLGWHVNVFRTGIRRKVFVASLADVFDDKVPREWRDELWELIDNTPNLDWLILTKRPQNIMGMLPDNWGEGWKNVWLGVTIEDEANLSRGLILKDIPAKLRFISYEPALEMVDFTEVLAGGKIKWLISGGESGSGSRPAKAAWFESAREQSRDIAYFHKQNGGEKRIDGIWGGNKLGGKEYHGFPNG